MNKLIFIHLNKTPLFIWYKTTPFRNPSTKVFLFSESIARDWFLASFSIRQLKQTAILLNAGLSYGKIRHSIFGVRYFTPP
jgi:hypothetical protein